MDVDVAAWIEAEFHVLDGVHASPLHDFTETPFWRELMEGLSLDHLSVTVTIKKAFEKLSPVWSLRLWGNGNNQYAFDLVDTLAANQIIVRRGIGSCVNVFVKIDGASAHDISSTTVLYSDDTEATFRLENTDTDDGCFLAPFLDDVCIADIAPGAFNYQQGLIKMASATVAGAKIHRTLNLK